MINSINDIHKKYDLVSVTDEDHQLSADEFNAIVSCLKNIQTYLSNVETTELSIQHDIPNNKFMVNTDDVEAFLKFTPRYKKIKTNTETGSVDTKDIQTECNITISSQKGNIQLPFEGERCYTGIQQSVDIRSLLATGTNYVDVMVSANGETEHALFTIVLTALSLSENDLKWYIPFYSTDNEYKIGGFRITGMIDKTVHITISGDDYYKEYTQHIGYNTYSSNAYTYKLTGEEDFPNAGTGSYRVDVYVTADDIETQHIIYDMLCVEDSSRYSAQLISIKQPTSKIPNLIDSKIAEYAIYDSGSDTSTVSIKIDTIQDDLEEVTLVPATELTVRTNTNNEFITTLHYNGEELTKNAIFTISIGNKKKSFNFVIDNSTSIPPVTGASFYIDPSNRYNSSSDKKSIINAANNTAFTATWSGVSFIDKVDGWTVDGDKENPRRALVLPAASSCNIDYRPLSDESNGSKVFDFVYKVENVSDYTKPIITICDNQKPESNSNEVVDDQEEEHKNFVGIKIFPTKILVHSNLKKLAEKYDLVQGTNIKDEELVSVQICICPDYNGYGNFLIIYVNGVKKCEFAYGAQDNFYIANKDFDGKSQGNVIFGGDCADLYLYSFRVYNKAFNYKNALTNFYNSLPDTDKKQLAFNEDNSVLGDGDEINLDKVRDTNKYNYFIVEPLDGAKLPAYGRAENYTCNCNFEMHYPGENNWDYYIENATLQGQGTTSMQYYVWNLRIRTDKNDDTRVAYSNKEFKNADVVKIDGGNHPAVKRITAKKNYASSMQSHKMGSTAAFNDLHDAVVKIKDHHNNEADARVAVYQYPAYGFIKQYAETGREVYKFIGLYTIGPDKGDKATFGYDGNYTYNLLSLEGLDHNRPLTLFKYPWTSDVKCYEDENKDEYIGIEYDNNQYDNGWEISAGNSDFVDTLWRHAYEQVYRNSPFIMGVSQPISSINSDVQSFRNQPLGNDRKYGDYDIWTSSDGILYYYDLKLKQYVSTGVNVHDDVASYIDTSEWDEADTLQKKNDAIIKARAKRFKATMSTYWDVDDTLFHYCFVMMFAASDNFAKNTYPYNFGASNSKWRWRQDDLDTLFDIDNYGRATKGTSVEYEDLTADGTQHVFKGEQSAFWTLVHLAYEVYDTEGTLSRMGHNILHAMCDLAAPNSSDVSYGYDSVMKFFQKYYFDKAEEYFTRSSYNVDAENSYEMAYGDERYMSNPPIDPLSQSLGSHIEATKFWLERRIIYLMSKYTFGEFESDSATELGRIVVRPQLGLNLSLVPAIDMYPTIISGQSVKYKSDGRVFAGNSAYIAGDYGGGNTGIQIAAADYIREIQGLQYLRMEGDTDLTISGKRLQRLDIGRSSVNDPNGTNISILKIGKCPSLEYINAENVNSLVDEIDLSGCPRIKEAYFDNTNIVSIKIANGAKIHTLTLPASIAALDLRNLPNLETLTIADTDNLSSIVVDNVSAFDTNYILQFLSVSSFSQDSATPTRRTATAIKIENLDISMNDSEMNSFLTYCINADYLLNFIHGIDENGRVDVSRYPVLTGKITKVDGQNSTLLHTSDIENIKSVFPYIKVDVSDLIVDFEDSRLRDTFFQGDYTVNQLATWTREQLINRFQSGTGYYRSSFNEFKYFDSITTYPGDSYLLGGPVLTEITLPKNLTNFESNSVGLRVEKINLGENKNFELVGNCLMGKSRIEGNDSKTAVHCHQKTRVKIPKYTDYISRFALCDINQNVLVIPRGVKSDTLWYANEIHKAIIFEDGGSTDGSFGTNYQACDVYIMENVPASSSFCWLDQDLNHHVYVPIGTRQKYIDLFSEFYSPDLFVEFNPETDETFLGLMEEYNNMDINVLS